jgi:hypothetical protein
MLCAAACTARDVGRLPSRHPISVRIQGLSINRDTGPAPVGRALPLYEPILAEEGAQALGQHRGRPLDPR